MQEQYRIVYHLQVYFYDYFKRLKQIVIGIYLGSWGAPPDIQAKWGRPNETADFLVSFEPQEG